MPALDSICLFLHNLAVEPLWSCLSTFLWVVLVKLRTCNFIRDDWHNLCQNSAKHLCTTLIAPHQLTEDHQSWPRLGSVHAVYVSTGTCHCSCIMLVSVCLSVCLSVWLTDDACWWTKQQLATYYPAALQFNSMQPHELVVSSLINAWTEWCGETS